MPYARLFVDGSRLQVRGEVVRLQRVVPMAGMADGYALLLRNRAETFTVHLGPAWYLERQDFPFDVADSVEVSGSRVILAGQPVLMAIEVRKKGKVLLLRNSDGLPHWSAWRNER